MAVAAGQVVEILSIIKRYLTGPQLTGLLRDLKTTRAYSRNQSFRQTIDVLASSAAPNKLWLGVVHEFDGNGRHRLVVEGIRGEWAGYQGIAVYGGYGAVTEYFSGLLPDVFEFAAVTGFKSKMLEGMETEKSQTRR